MWGRYIFTVTDVKCTISEKGHIGVMYSFGKVLLFRKFSKWVMTNVLKGTELYTVGGWMI